MVIRIDADLYNRNDLSVILRSEKSAGKQKKSCMIHSSNTMVNWTNKSFYELTTTELYAILKLRSEVFVVEQDCVYMDPDDKDQHSFHQMGWMNEILVAYSRIIPQGISYSEASIGRVVTAPAFRRNKLGRPLMEHSIHNAFQQFKCNTIKIGAQGYLQQFYESLGFVKTSEVYLEDGIPHIEMLLEK